jgi:hypothetical protein
VIAPLPPWEPDQSRFEAAEGTINVQPRHNGWGPIPKLNEYSAALGGVCRGAILVRQTDGSITVFAATAAAIKQLVGTTWTDRTRTVGGAYNLGDGESWSTAQFGDFVVFVQANDVPQVLELGVDTNFRPLGGSPPQARYVAVSGDYLLLCSTAANPNRLHRSGWQDIEHWEFGVRLSDYQDIAEGGWIRGMVGRERGALIFMDNAIHLYENLPGSQLLFTRTAVDPKRGVVAPDSIVARGNEVFFRSEDGFYRFATPESENINEGRCERWFQDTIDLESLSLVQGAADPVFPVVMWRFTTSSALTYSDRILGLHVGLNRWFHFEEDTQWLLGAATPGYTLEEVETVLGYATLESIPFSLDSRHLKGGRPVMSAFNSSHKLALFTGGNRAASVETADMRIGGDGRVGMITGMRVLAEAEAGVFSGQLGSAATLGADMDWGPTVTAGSTGLIPVRRRARALRARVLASEDAVWDNLQAVEMAQEHARVAGRR